MYKHPIGPHKTTPTNHGVTATHHWVFYQNKCSVLSKVPQLIIQQLETDRKKNQPKRWNLTRTRLESDGALLEPIINLLFGTRMCVAFCSYKWLESVHSASQYSKCFAKCVARWKSNRVTYFTPCMTKALVDFIAANMEEFMCVCVCVWRKGGAL